MSLVRLGCVVFGSLKLGYVGLRCCFKVRCVGLCWVMLGSVGFVDVALCWVVLGYDRLCCFKLS